MAVNPRFQQLPYGNLTRVNNILYKKYFTLCFLDANYFLLSYFYY